MTVAQVAMLVDNNCRSFDEELRRGRLDRSCDIGDRQQAIPQDLPEIPPLQQHRDGCVATPGLQAVHRHGGSMPPNIVPASSKTVSRFRAAIID
jgi:hypothetical protein